MLLLVDAGNTQIKWALADRAAAPGAWHSSGAVVHTQIDTLAALWQTLPIEHVLVSNVAGDSVRERLQRSLPANTPIEWFSASSERAGIRNRYRDPLQLGCDRFAAAIGAHQAFPAMPLIVATCGTATTVDAISADGVFLGGMILPGLGLMASALATNTALLPQVEHATTISAPFADNTQDAIISGCLAAQAGAIERAVHAHGGPAQVACIVSGGAGQWVSAHLTLPHHRVDNLVLLGLFLVANTTLPC